MNTALLIVGAQVSMFGSNPVYRAEVVQVTLSDLIQRARASGAPVVFIRNKRQAGEPDEAGSSGWSIHPALAPDAGELIVDKNTSDAFFQTGLIGILSARGIRRVVIAGMQTEYGIDTTARRAFSLEYDVVLAADAHSTYSGELSAEQIIAHHNRVLTSFATLTLSADISFESVPEPAIYADSLAPADRAGIAAGLAEWQGYDRWLVAGEGQPFWPHSHPGRVADTLKQMWKPDFKPQARYHDPPRWEMGLARTFLQPLENIPMVFRRSALTVVAQAIDHLLQNPRNPLSPHISQIGDEMWMYDARDLRLFYVPNITRDKAGTERRYIFLMWLAPGLPVRNPFA
ncbi:MAG: cysteine hydrolase family protein [Chloroflexota bacterium]